MDSPVNPPTWRIVAAFLIVPALASMAVAVVMPLYAGLPDVSERILRTAVMYALFGAYPPTLVLGLPAFLFLKRRVSPTIWACALVGAIVASLPWVSVASLSNPDFASVDGRAIVVHGVKTLWGWIEVIKMAGMFGACGAVGGGLFWLVAAAGTQPSKHHAAPH